MPNNTRCIIVINAIDKDAENQWIVDNVDPNGASTFSSPLTSNGLTITNYWCSGNWYDWQYDEIVDHFTGRIYYDTPDTVLNNLGLQRYVEG